MKYPENLQNIEDKNTPPNKKGKSFSGRKPGYRMKEWQKEVQLASLRNRDLENFNIFLQEFASIFRELAGERFFLAPSQIDRDLFFPEDHVYILEKVLQRSGISATEALFFYRDQNRGYKKACLKTYEQYTLTRDRKLFPLEETVRKDLLNSIRTAAFREGLHFPEQNLIYRNLSDLKDNEFMKLVNIEQSS